MIFLKYSIPNYKSIPNYSKYGFFSQEKKPSLGINLWKGFIKIALRLCDSARGTNAYIFFVFNLSELLTTLTELNAIAPAANVGLNIPNAARGIPITL